MKEKKKNMASKICITLFLLFTGLISKAQIEKLNFPNRIDFKLPTKTIINNILSDKSLQILRLDTSTIVFPSLTYKVSQVDSMCLKFHREHFSSLSIHLSDSCLFYYIKAFCLENLKMSKESKNNKKQFFKGEDYNITIYETKGFESSKYNIWIRSKKYPINI